MGPYTQLSEQNYLTATPERCKNYQLCQPLHCTYYGNNLYYNSYTSKNGLFLLFKRGPSKMIQEKLDLDKKKS